METKVKRIRKAPYWVMEAGYGDHRLEPIEILSPEFIKDENKVKTTVFEEAPPGSKADDMSRLLPETGRLCVFLRELSLGEKETKSFILLTLYDEHDETLECWELWEIKMVEVNFGDLDYSSRLDMRIETTWHYDNMELVAFKKASPRHDSGEQPAPQDDLSP